MGASNIAWFITLYAIGAYARKYDFNPNYTSKTYLIAWLIISLTTYIFTVVMSILGTKSVFFANKIYVFYPQNMITILLISLTLFMTFVKMNVNYHKWINVIASATFGVYLIHDDQFVRPFLWEDLFKNAQYQDSVALIPYSIAVVILVYTCCTIIDLLRKKLIEKPYLILVDRYADKMQKLFEKIIIYSKEIVFGKE